VSFSADAFPPTWRALVSDLVRQLKWSDLRVEDRERVLLVISAFEEFAAGYAHFTALGATLSSVEPLMRFISGATFHWLYLLYRSEETVFSVLRLIAFSDYVQRAEDLLAVKIGAKTVGHFISEWRNKNLVHTDFTHQRVEKALFRHFEATDEITRDAYRTTMQVLADLTVEIQLELWKQFPEAREALRTPWIGGAAVGDNPRPSMP